MKRLITFLIILTLLLSACGKTEESEATTEAFVTDFLYGELSASQASLKSVDSLPDAKAMLSAGPVGGNPMFYLFESGLEYYIENRTSEEESEIYKCEVSLPDGYIGGEIVDIYAGGGSGEVFIIVATMHEAQIKYLEYYFFCDSFTSPVSIRELDGYVM